MGFRILCDEHVPPQTAEYLEKDGHVVTHVSDTAGLGADDPEIAAYAVREEFAVLTNDSDFLDGSRYPDVTVFYYPESELPAWDLATAIADVEPHYDDQESLPRTIFL